MFLRTFLNDLSKFKKLKTINEKAEKRKTNVYDIALELYNELLETYFDESYYLSHVKRTKMIPKYKLEKLFIKGYDCSMWSKNEEESTDKEKATDKKNQLIKKNLLMYHQCHH